MGGFTITVDYDTQTLNAFLRSLNDKVLQKSMALSLNRTIDTLRKEVNLNVRKNLKIQYSGLNKSLIISHRARSNELIQSQYSELTIDGKAQPIINFGARQVASGVSVNVKGSRKIIKHAFISTMKSGHRGVFLRARWVKAAGYMPIKTKSGREKLFEAFTTRVTEVFEDKREMYQEKAQQKFTKEFGANFRHFLLIAEKKNS